MHKVQHDLFKKSYNRGFLLPFHPHSTSCSLLPFNQLFTLRTSLTSAEELTIQHAMWKESIEDLHHQLVSRKKPTVVASSSLYMLLSKGILLSTRVLTYRIVAVMASVDLPQGHLYTELSTQPL